MYILLSGTFAVVVTSAVRGTMISSVVQVRWSLYPNIHFILLYDYNPHHHLASVSILERGTTPFFMDNLCHTGPFAFIRVLSVAVIEGSAISSAANRYPIVDILSLTSVVEIVFNRLSNICLLLGIVIRPHANASL